MAVQDVAQVSALAELVGRGGLERASEALVRLVS